MFSKCFVSFIIFNLFTTVSHAQKENSEVSLRTQGISFWIIRRKKKIHQNKKYLTKEEKIIERFIEKLIQKKKIIIKN